MKIIGKAILPLIPAILILTSCNGFTSAPAMLPTDVLETSTTSALPEIVETPTLEATPGPSIIQFLDTRLPPTPAPLPTLQSSPTAVPRTPTIVVLENKITWTECIAPSIDYAHSAPDYEFAARCLNMEIPVWDDHDRKMAGERIEGRNGSDLKQVVGKDVFLVKHDSTNGCCDYQYLKNGQVMIETSAPAITFDPNRNLWNIGGKVVWELITDPPTIFVDGVDFNEKYQSEGIFKPYSLNNKLLYIARQDGKYHIIYNEETIGPAFDEIYIKYCCGTTGVWYGGGRYLFWGKREGTYYVVGIH